jgi:hypothetical protein
LPAGGAIGESNGVDRARWDERYSGTKFEWTTRPNQFVAAELARVGLDKGRRLAAARRVEGRVNWVVADLDDYQPAADAFGLVLIAYFQVGAELRARVLARAAAALVPGGTLFVIGHDLINLTEGTGGPQYPEVLYTPEAITAELPGLRVLQAERVRRTVEKDDGPATAIDTLVRAQRP